MKLLLRAYPRRWRERYGDELLALIEAEPLTWTVAANVVCSGLGERVRGSGPPQLRVLWAWSLFAIGGMAFQKTSEAWQVVVSPSRQAVPAAAFDVVVVAAALGSAAVLAGIALALPALVRDLRAGGWVEVRRTIGVAAATTVLGAAALLTLQLERGLPAAATFVALALLSLLAWTHAAVVCARRLRLSPAHGRLAVAVLATMVATTAAAGIWLGEVTAQAPGFVGAAQLAVVATFMLGGTALAADGALRSLRG